MRLAFNLKITGLVHDCWPWLLIRIGYAYLILRKEYQPSSRIAIQTIVDCSIYCFTGSRTVNFHFFIYFLTNRLLSENVILNRFLWLTLLASSSASSAYVQYASGASTLPPRYPLKAKWY